MVSRPREQRIGAWRPHPVALGDDVLARLIPGLAPDALPDDVAEVRAEAADQGVDDGRVPPVRRLAWQSTSDARLLQGLAWGAAPADVVLLHGAGLQAHAWDGVLLHGLVPALALDLPGHGWSTFRPDAVYGPREIAEDLVPLLQCLVAAGVVAPGAALVGHSLGGLTALRVADATPLLWRRLVLVDVLPLPPGAGGRMAQFLATPLGTRAEAVAAARAAGLGRGGTFLDRAVRLNTRERTDGRAVWRHHLGLGLGRLHVDDPADAWTLIARSRVPIDAVVAEDGVVGGSDVAHLRLARPGARVVRLPGGHNLHEDAPAELASTLARLVGADGPSAPTRAAGPRASRRM